MYNRDMEVKQEIKENRPLDLISVWLLVSTIILSPLYVLRWSYFGFLPTTLLELMIWVVVITWFLSRIGERTYRWPLSVGLTVFLASFLGSAILGTLLAEEKWQALGIFRAYFIEPAMIFLVSCDLVKRLGSKQFTILGKHISTKEIIWLSVITAAGWLAIIGTAQTIFEWPVITNHQWDRAHGVFNNGNALALFIGPVLAVFGIQLVKKIILVKKRVFSYGSYILLSLMMVSFIGTKSTGGLIALIVTWFIYYLITRYGLHKLFSIVYVGGFIVFLIFITQISRFTPATDNPWVRQAGTEQVRLCVWEGTRDLVYNNWVLGVGLSGFQEVYSSTYTTCDAEPLVYPHNIFLNFWVELGVVGLISIVGLFYFIFRQQWNEFTAAFLYWTIHGLVDVPYFKNDLAVLFWVFLLLWYVSKEFLVLPSLRQDHSV